MSSHINIHVRIIRQSSKNTSLVVISEKSLEVKKTRYRPEIDGLRAFAVVAVIINHFNKDVLPGGYLGVDIFFVISGYVITSSLFGRPSKDFKDFISGFYERRIKRLVPALSVFILITSIAICLFNPSPGTSLKTGITSLFGLSNLYLFKNSTDYFAQSTELNVFTHTWSLGVEEQFYILFPFLIWFSGFGRQTKNGARNLFLIVGILTIASLIGFLYLYPTNQPAAYFLMPSRFWEMAAGCLIFIGFQKRASVEQLLEKVPPLLVVALIVGVMFLPMSMAAVSTIAVVVLSSILIASLKKQTAAFKVFTNPQVVNIGLISYSLYLWHWGVLSISRRTIGIHWWSVPFQVALMLGLAIASYRWIETPLRKGNWFGKRWKTLAVGGGVLVALSGGLIALYKPLKGKFYTGNPNYNRFGGKVVINNITLNDECTPREVVDGLKPECINLHSKPSGRIHLLGDSHMQHYLPMFERLSEEYGWSYYFYGRSGFPVGKRYLKGKQGKLVDDADMKYAINKVIERLDSGDIFIISERNERNFSPYMFDLGAGYVKFVDENGDSVPKREALKNYKEYLIRLAGKINSRGAVMILFQPTPSFKGIVNGVDAICSEWYGKYNNHCSYSMGSIDRREWVDHVSVIKRMHEQVANIYGNTLTFDPFTYLCPPNMDKCPRKMNGKMLYFDDDHLSDYSSEYIYSNFASFLRSKGLLRRSD
ncbi:putative acyltransferase [Synechococcus sp. CC9311]|nr:putative acyltransferase [Synechococcus sp. CC9311]